MGWDRSKCLNKIMIDLRSDTVTLPTRGMLDAISCAKLGDDVLNEDPTIQKLEKKSADLSGKEASLLVPSGTMANLTAILAHCKRGDEVILGNLAHTFLYEAGGISSLGGVHSCQLKNQKDGTILIEDIKNSIRKDDIHFPTSRLICLENTHNRCYGFPLQLDYLISVKSIAVENNLKLHVDGARLFNAAIAIGASIKEICEPVDSVTFCLSKGLSAPIGSLVCGDEDFIRKVKRLRKVLGGGMRQAGIIAAAGIEALDTMPDQLILDHKHAQILAQGLFEIPGAICDPNLVPTNIIYFSIRENTLGNKNLLDEMEKNGVKFFELSPNNYRLVTHSGISERDVLEVIKIFSQLLS